MRKIDLEKLSSRQLMDEKNKRCRKLLDIRLDLERVRGAINLINDEQVKRLLKREFKFAKRGKDD